MHERPRRADRPPAERPEILIHASQCDVVGVAETDGELRLVTRCPVAAGDRLFELEGDLVSTPTRYSVQVGKSLHLDAGSDYPLEEVFARFYWRFMNHHCEPATMIRGREVIALRDLASGDAVTFNYNTTEADMAEPFECRCGSVRCEGTIRGANHLSERDVERLRSFMAPHLFEG